MRNATSCIFSQSTVHNMKKREENKIRLHKSIFIYFFILLFSSSARFLSLLGKVCVVLFTEWKIVITSSTFKHFLTFFFRRIVPIETELTNRRLILFSKRIEQLWAKLLTREKKLPTQRQAQRVAKSKPFM